MAYKKYDKSKNYQARNGDVFSAERITNASYTYWKDRDKNKWVKFRKSNSIENGGKHDGHGNVMFVNPNTKRLSIFYPASNFGVVEDNIPDWRENYKSRKNETQELETNNKSSTMKKMNFEMGPVTGDQFKLTLMGGVAVAVDGGYSSYDKEDGSLTDVSGFTMDFDGAFYNMPSVEVEEGDLIKTKNGYGYVTKTKENSVKVMLLDGEVKEIISTKSPFGFEFYTKVVSIFDMAGGEGNSMFGDMNPMMMMMMGGSGSGSGNSPFGGDMMSMMMMSQMMGGEGKSGMGGLGDLFGGKKGKSKGKGKSKS